MPFILSPTTRSKQATVWFQKCYGKIWEKSHKRLCNYQRLLCIKKAPQNQLFNYIFYQLNINYLSIEKKLVKFMVKLNILLGLLQTINIELLGVLHPSSFSS